MRLGLHANPRKPDAVRLARRALELVGDRATVVLSDELQSVQPQLEHADWPELRADLVVVIGGDGTFLHALRHTALPVVPVNAGTFGVLAEVNGRSPKELETAVHRLVEGHYFLEERTKLAAEIDGTPLPDVSNEYVVHATPVGRMGHFELTFDARRAGTVRADGLIVATPTGSTAYALSSAGPIVEPEVDGVVLTAIAPFRAEARAVVYGGLRTLKIRSLDDAAAVVLADGEGEHRLGQHDAVTVYRSPRRASLVRFGASFFDRLRGKRILPWSDDRDPGSDAGVPPSS